MDRKARNRLIVRALEKELPAGSGWSPGFFDRLREVDSEIIKAVDELLTSIRQARKSKPLG